MEERYGARRVRIGLISDIHWMPSPPGRADAWHGPGEYAGALERLRLALRHFGDMQVDAIVLAGDLAHRGDADSLAAVLTACNEAPAPVLVATGNHDVSQDPGLLAHAHACVGDPNVSLVSPAGTNIGGMRIAGVHVGETCGLWRPRLTCLPDTACWGSEPVVLISHYPVLSLSSLICGQGLAYPADLLDRDDLRATLIGRSAPTIVLGGHVHARATIVDGPIVRLTVGAVIEPPYECSVIELDGTAPAGLMIKRESVSLLDETHEHEPVFSSASETWQVSAGEWTQLRVCRPGASTWSGRAGIGSTAGSDRPRLDRRSAGE